jgi:hypothetical protein
MGGLWLFFLHYYALLCIIKWEWRISNTHTFHADFPPLFDCLKRRYIRFAIPYIPNLVTDMFQKIKQNRCSFSQSVCCHWWGKKTNMIPERACKEPVSCRISCWILSLKCWNFTRF